MLEYISTHADKAGFKQDVVKNIELAMEEALVNVIVHGYKTNGGDIAIELKSPIKQPGIEITITDEGIPFNPDTYPSASSPLTQAASFDNGQEVGGWGLFLIFKMMDKVEYARINGKNVLKLEKHL